MSGVPANSEYAQALSKEFGDGLSVMFLSKPVNISYVVGLVDGAKTAAVIDDELQITELFSRFLTKKGINVDMYSKGSDFLNSVQNDYKKYDIVFCDTDMPMDMFGPNVLRQYHKLVKEKEGVNHGSNI
jgi:DNA-binding NtrC family response regulator